MNKDDINHLQMADHISRWREKTLPELHELQQTLIKKRDVVKDSHSVAESLTRTLTMLEIYIQERTIREGK